MIRVLLISFLLFLSGCKITQFGKSELHNVRESQVNEITDVNEANQYAGIFLDLEGAHLLGHGLLLSYGSNKYGTIDVQGRINQEEGWIQNTSKIFEDRVDNYSVNDRVGFGFEYSYPLFKSYLTKRRGISMGCVESRSDENSSGLSGIIFYSDRKVLQTISLHGGFKKWYTAFDTYDPLAYGIIDEEEYAIYEEYKPEFFDENYFRVFSQNSFLSFGASLSRTFNSSASIDLERGTYSGYENRIIGIDAKLLFGLNSSVRPIDFNGLTNISQTAPFRRLGAEISVFGKLFNKFTGLGFNIGTGFYPGYYDSIRDAYFFRFGVSIGIARMWSNK